MIKFNKMIKSTGCMHCRAVQKVLRKINRKLAFPNKINKDNIKDTVKFNVIIYPIANKLTYEGEDKLGTPHLTLGHITKGQIIEDISIRGEYEKDIMVAFLSGYMNKQLIPGWQDVYADELKEEHEEVFGE